MFASPVLGLLAMFLAAAQQNTAPTVTVKLDKAQVAAGAKVTGVVTVTFAEGLHGYQNPPAQDYQIPIKLSAKGITLVKATYPKGISKKVGGDATESMVYEGAVKIPVVLKTVTKPGVESFSIVLDYQQCNAASCYPPSAVTVKATVKVLPAKKGKKA